MKFIKIIVKTFNKVFKFKTIIISSITKNAFGVITNFGGNDDDEEFYLKKNKLIRRIIEYNKLGYNVEIKTFDNHKVFVIENRYLVTVCNEGSTNHMAELPIYEEQ